MGQIEWRVGQRVRILDTPKLHEWHKYREVIGKEFILDEADVYNLHRPNFTCHFNKNQYQINFTQDMFELVETEWDK